LGRRRFFPPSPPPLLAAARPRLPRRSSTPKPVAEARVARSLTGFIVRALAGARDLAVAGALTGFVSSPELALTCSTTPRRRGHLTPSRRDRGPLLTYRSFLSSRGRRRLKLSSLPLDLIRSGSRFPIPRQRQRRQPSIRVNPLLGTSPVSWNRPTQAILHQELTRWLVLVVYYVFLDLLN
jgi:hypothetical protein